MKSTLIEEFENYHGFRFPEWWERGPRIIEILFEAKEARDETLRSASEELLAGEPTLGLLDQLLERTHEHVVGAIICFATKNGPSAEVSARVAIESSVNVRYILAGDRNVRMLSWLREYINHDRAQIDRWHNAVLNHPDHEEIYDERLETRKRILQLRESLVEQLEQEFLSAVSIEQTEIWPKIAERFKAIGEEVSHRTAYARLSSQVHADAEDTLNFFFAKVSEDETAIDKMSEETIAYTEYMVLFAAYFLLIAMKYYVKKFSGNDADVIESSIDTTIEQMNAIATDWDW